jgi:Undecaprenyl-phosphate glucose phosphotransferase
MLERLRTLDKSYVSARPQKSTSTIRLSTALTVYAVIEFLAVAVAAFGAASIYHKFFWQAPQIKIAYVPAALIIASLVLLVSLGLHNFVGIRREPRHVFLWKIVGSVSIAFTFFVTLLFFIQFSDYSRGTFIWQIVAVGLTVVTTRTFFYSWVRRAVDTGLIEGRRAFLIGSAANCSKYADRLMKSGIKVVGSHRLPKSRDLKTAYNLDTSEILTKLRSRRPDDVIVLTTDQATPIMVDVVSRLAELPASIHIIPVGEVKYLATAQVTELGNVKTIRIYSPPLTAFDSIIKRAFDLIFSTIALIALSPLFLVISIAIKLDSPGPVFFRQKRHGFNNEEIRVFKFRSMNTIEDGDRFSEAVRNDPRVTRIGRIMRSTNIDELPQLLNVLRGEMSVVGPRPHATSQNAFYNKIIGRFSRRHNVKPGITGWAQVNGFRGATDTVDKMQQRIECDLYYVDNWSFLFDLKIIMMTLFTKRAYINAY